MPPIFWAVAITEGMQLVEKMIVAAIINRTVWIIDPLCRSGDMKKRPRRIGLSVGSRRFDSRSRPRDRVHCGIGTRSGCNGDECESTKRLRGESGKWNY